VAHWLALLPLGTRDPGSIPVLGDCVEFAHSPLVRVGFLSQSKVEMCRLGWLARLNCHLVRESSRIIKVELLYWRVGTDLMGRMASFCTVAIL